MSCVMQRCANLRCRSSHSRWDGLWRSKIPAATTTTSPCADGYASKTDWVGIGRRAPKIFDLVISVGQQAAEFGEETVRIDGRETVACRQRRDLRTMEVHEAIRHRDQASIRLARL